MSEPIAESAARQAGYTAKYEGLVDELRALRAGVEAARPELTAFFDQLFATLDDPAMRRVAERLKPDKRQIERRDDVRTRTDLVARAIKLGLTEDAALQVLFSVYESTPTPTVELIDKLQALVVQHYATLTATVTKPPHGDLYSGLWPSPMESPEVNFVPSSSSLGRDEVTGNGDGV